MFLQRMGIASSGAKLPFPRPLAWYNETSLQGDHTWLNVGTGGSLYNFDVVTNPGDLSQESFAGLTVLQNNNAGYLTSSNYPAETTPGNTFLVAKINAFGFNMNLITEAGNSTFVSVTLSSRWRAMLGGFVEVAGAQNTVPVIIVVDWIDSAAFQIEVVGLGTGSTNDGTLTNIAFNTMLADTGGGANYDGWLGERMDYNSILNASDRAAVIEYLQARWLNQLSFVADQATITPSITLTSGTPDWLVVEDDGSEFTYNTPAFSHTRTDPGPVVVTLRNTAELAALVTMINFFQENITAMNGGFDNLASYKIFTNLLTISIVQNALLKFTGSIDLPGSLVNFNIDGNTPTNITGTLADIPSAVTDFRVQNTASIITSTVADLPAGMRILYVFRTPSIITGTVAELPASALHIRAYETSSIITGTDIGAPAATGIQTLHMQSTAYTAAQLDTLLQYIHTYRANWTNNAPSLNIGGTNPAPGGIYQDATPPTTGKEYAFKLENDPDGEGFNTWDITFTP